MDTSDWLECCKAVVRLIDRLKSSLATESNPTPWIDPSSVQGSLKLQREIKQRAFLAIQRALLNDELRASFVDGAQTLPIPKVAFTDPEVVEKGLSSCRLEIDPLWPDEWQEWNHAHWFVLRQTLLAWLGSESPLAACNFEDVLSSSLNDSPKPITARLPSKEARVPISEALSYIAFHIALPAERMDRAMRWGKFCGGNLDESQRRLENALATLCKAGSNREIAFFGRYVGGDSGKVSPTDTIQAVQLDDFRRYHFGYDMLCYGRGLFARDVLAAPRSDYFTDVKVSRDDLLRGSSTGEDESSFSDEERREWMRAHAHLNVDESHRRFKQEARFDGTKQTEWRREWRDVTGRGPGRPRGT